MLITGGAGFLVHRLARQLLARGELADSQGRAQRIGQLVLLDVAPANDFGDTRVRVVTGDIFDAAVLRQAIDAVRTYIEEELVPAGGAARQACVGAGTVSVWATCNESRNS